MKVHVNDPEGKFYLAYCDGYQLPNCFFADEEVGEAHCYEVNSEGRMFLRPGRDEPSTVVIRGRIELRRKADEEIAQIKRDAEELERLLREERGYGGQIATA